jgi:hypothetical protein
VVLIESPSTLMVGQVVDVMGACSMNPTCCSPPSHALAFCAGSATKQNSAETIISSENPTVKRDKQTGFFLLIFLSSFKGNENNI